MLFCNPNLTKFVFGLFYNRVYIEKHVLCIVYNIHVCNTINAISVIKPSYHYYDFLKEIKKYFDIHRMQMLFCNPNNAIRILNYPFGQ